MRISFLKDLGLFAAQLVFVPLSVITLISESRHELVGLGDDLFTMTLLWSALLVSGFFTFAAKNIPDPGRLTVAGIIFLIVVFCLTIPITLGFAAMTFVTFAAGGPEVLFVLWKGIMFFGFVCFWFQSNA